MYRVILFTLISGALAVAAPQPQPFRRPLLFEPNLGQAPRQVKWLARGPGYQLFLTSEGVTMKMQEGAAEPSVSEAHNSAQSPGLQLSKLKYSMLEMKLTGSQPWNKITGLEPTGGVSNYIRGSNGKDSLYGIPTYARVSVSGVYDGIDLVFYSHEGDLEYDFVVKPGADPSKIQLAFEGTKSIRVDDQSGDLILTTGGGSELREVRPKMYQQVENRRAEVAGGFELLRHGRAAFTVASYDRRRPLVIDPIVRFEQTLGGSGIDVVRAVAVDASGNSYITGETASHNFPVTNNSKWADCSSGSTVFDLQFCVTVTNIFTAKLSPNGTILFSSYGGVGSGNGIAVDSTGVYITGAQYAPDCGAFCAPIGFGGGSDLYIAKLSPTGALIYEQTIEGSADDAGFAVAVDSQQNAWVVGATSSPEWIRGLHSGVHVLVAKYSPTGVNVYIQAFGSDGADRALGVAVDPVDQPWITGQTCGNGWPTTDGIFHPATGCSVFVMQLETAGSMRMSTVFGGSSGGDAGTGIVPNGPNVAFVVGYTNAPTFPTVQGAFQTVRASNGAQAFVTYVDSSSFQGRIIRSTLLGGDGDTYGTAIAAPTPVSGVFVAGTTTSAHFPGVVGIATNAQVGFLSKLDFHLSQVEYTELAGASITSIAVQPTSSGGIPEIFIAGLSAPANSGDALVMKIDDDVAQSQALWQDPSTGSLITGLLDAQGNVTSTQKLAVQCGPSNGCSQSWKVIGTLDANHDGVGDILLYDAAGGSVQAWLLDSSGAIKGIQNISRLCGTSDGCSKTWEPVGVGDFNHDGIDDLLWHNNSTGELQAWLLDGAGNVPGTLTLSKKCAVSDGCWVNWKIAGIADFDGDGIDDLFWLNVPTGSVVISLMNDSGAVRTTQTLANRCGPSDGCSATWKAVGLADVNHDGRSDLLWENPTTGELSAWLLNGTDRILGTQSLSLKCNAASGCPQGALPVGILRNLRAIP